MKRITVILFLVSLICHVDAQKYFRIIDATSMSWSGGMAQSGTGITYSVNIVLLTNQKITFNDFWVGKEYGNPEMVSVSYADGRSLRKGDTVIANFTVHHYPPQSQMLNMPMPAYKSPPIPIKGDALLGFTVHKATRYRSVTKFKELPSKKYQ